MTARLVALLVAGATISAGSAAAQDRPVVFLHGLAAQSTDWNGAAMRLQTALRIEPRLPGLDWNQTYQTQAQGLHAALGWLPASAVAIGHSNGGIVGREWSRVRKLDGLITLGTPHRGAPLMGNFLSWRLYHDRTPSQLNWVLNAFSRVTGFTWAYWYIQHYMSWIFEFSLASIWWFTANTAFQMNVPVTFQMVPDSPYFNSLNSGTNLSREAAAIHARVGIVSVAKNFFYAGPARAARPDEADGIAWTLYSAAYTLEYWGTYILTTADPADVDSIDQGLALLNLADHLFGIDPLYCRLVSTRDASACIPNDGIVPVTSQEYPGAPNLIIGTNNDGPAHIQQKDRSDDALYQALVWYVGVSPRSGPGPGPGPVPPPPPPTPPPDPDDPGGEDDGGGVIATSGTDVMVSGQQMGVDEYVHSADERYHLTYQSDGNLVLYEENWAPIWSTGTDGVSPGVVVMQHDGNFVMYDATDRAVWSSGTDGNPGAFLVVQNDGNLVLYSSSRQPLWSTGTQR